MGEVEEEEGGVVGVGDDPRRYGAGDGVAGEVEGSKARGKRETRGEREAEEVGGEVERVERGERGRQAGGDGPRERVAGEVEHEERAREGAGELSRQRVGGEVERAEAAEERERRRGERAREVEAPQRELGDGGGGGRGCWRRGGVERHAAPGRRQRAAP